MSQPIQPYSSRNLDQDKYEEIEEQLSGNPTQEQISKAEELFEGHFWAEISSESKLSSSFRTYWSHSVNFREEAQKIIQAANRKLSPSPTSNNSSSFFFEILSNEEIRANSPSTDSLLSQFFKKNSSS